MNTQVVILAGGMATRLGSLTASRPKSLVMLNNKPFLEYQINMLRTQGIRNILLCLGHLSEQIIDYFGNGHKLDVKITYSIENKPLGTAGALKNAEKLLADTFATLYGDAYLFLEIEEVMKHFVSNNKLGLMTVYRNKDLYDKSNTTVDSNGMVTKYDKQNTGTMEYIDYGFSVFLKQVVEWIPPEEYYPLEEIFDKLIQMKELASLEIKKRFYEIGSPTGLAAFEKYAKDNGL